MKSSEFHITVQREKILLSWGNQQEVPYGLASGLEKDRLIARILHKVLNMRLSADETGVLGRDEFKVLGSTLFKLLFNDDGLRMHFNAFYKEAVSSPEMRHRLILEFDREAFEMAPLPWEYLYYEDDEAQEAFLAAHPKKCIDLIRQLPFKGNWLEFDKTQQSIAPPLKVLVVVADPDRAEKSIDPKGALAYFKQLEDKFGDIIKFKLLYQPEVDSFGEKLNQIVNSADGEFFPHVIHFIGYSRMDGNIGQICFVRKTGEDRYAENWINEETFAGYFEEWTRLPHLVILHVCDSIPIGNYKEDKGIAIKLAKKGVPFVIALQNPTLDWMAQVLVEKIYDNLLEGEDIAMAVTEARFFLARKLVDALGSKYDNYAHKVFGSVVLFSVVQKPFALDLNHPEEEVVVPKDDYKICAEHPDKKYSLVDNWCSVCGKKLVLPSQVTGSAKPAPESAADAKQPKSADKSSQSEESNFDISMEILNRTSKSSGKAESAQDFSLNIADKQANETRQNAVFIESRTTTVSVEAILNLEQEGLKKELEYLIKKLIFLREEKSKTSDASQRFDLDEEIKELEDRAEKIKEKLNI